MLRNDNKQNISLDGIHYENHIYYPRNIDEVQRLIKFAKTNNFTVRTMGSQHSPPDAIFGNDKNQLRINLDGELRKIHFIQEDDSKEFALVSVGAGCYLGINPKDKRSNLQNSFNWQVDQVGYALTSLGGISHQSIAGFVQTSSSGGSSGHSVSDMLEEIEFINGKGEICVVKKGEDAFNAIAVGMGLFGIITNLKFKLPKKYLVEGVEENKAKHESLLRKDVNGNYSALEKALFEDLEYAHINWFPQRFVDRTIEWSGKRVAANLPIEEYHHPLRSKFLSYLAAFVLKSGSALDKLSNHNLFAEGLKSILLKAFVPLPEKKLFRDTWYKALPIDDQTDVDGLINTLFCELWFPREQINTVMSRLEKLIATDSHAAGNFIIEFYAAKKTPFWMSPAYDRDTFRVDLYWWSRNFGNSNTYFTRFWNVLLDIPGVRLHWGKYLPIPGQIYGGGTCDNTQIKKTIFNREFLANAYPKLNEWLSLRDKMDPQQLFVNDYWRKIFSIPPRLTKTVTHYGPHLFAEANKDYKKKEDTVLEKLNVPKW